MDRTLTGSDSVCKRLIGDVVGRQAEALDAQRRLAGRQLGPLAFVEAAAVQVVACD
jgi:hypothetical protein